MAGSRQSLGFGVVAMLAALIFALFIPSAVQAQIPVPAPAPSPSSNGSSLDQGIAYVLMLLALSGSRSQDPNQRLIEKERKEYLGEDALAQ
ncbi:Arabinogalactan peptide 20, partial [Mucuna pruriens]